MGHLQARDSPRATVLWRTTWDAVPDASAEEAQEAPGPGPPHLQLHQTHASPEPASARGLRGHGGFGHATSSPTVVWHLCSLGSLPLATGFPVPVEARTEEEPPGSRGHSGLSCLPSRPVLRRAGESGPGAPSPAAPLARCVTTSDVIPSLRLHGLGGRAWVRPRASRLPWPSVSGGHTALDGGGDAVGDPHR